MELRTWRMSEPERTSGVLMPTPLPYRGKHTAMEAQRGNATCPRSHSSAVTRPCSEPRSFLVVPGSMRASQVALVVKNPPANAGDTRDMGLLPGSGGSPREGNGNPLQYSCLENPMDRGAWWATVHGVTESRTRLERLSSSSSCI